MIISGFMAESFQDWNLGLSSIIFTSHCNFRCPACYANKLLCTDSAFTPDEILKKVSRKAGYIKNIVICGGEASLEEGLEEFLIKLKSKNFNVKLDTNGSNPDILEKIIDNGLIDHVAMDIKAPGYLYAAVAGLKDGNAADTILKRIEKSVLLLNGRISYELRTTIAPVFRNDTDYSWLNADECMDMVKWIYDILKGDKPEWYIQSFTAKSADEMIDRRLAKDNLPVEYHETPGPLISEIREKALSLNYDLKIR